MLPVWRAVDANSRFRANPGTPPTVRANPMPLALEEAFHLLRDWIKTWQREVRENSELPETVSFRIKHEWNDAEGSGLDHTFQLYMKKGMENPNPTRMLDDDNVRMLQNRYNSGVYYLNGQRQPGDQENLLTMHAYKLRYRDAFTELHGTPIPDGTRTTVEYDRLSDGKSVRISHKW